MPFFVPPPPEPPALIQPVSPASQTDRPGLTNSHRKSQNPSPASIPSVVEFYYSDPKQTPNFPLEESFPSNNGNADLLGSPLSVTKEVSPSQGGKSPAGETLATNAQNQVVFGLNPVRGNQQTQETKLLITTKSTGQKREFRVSNYTGATEVVQNPDNSSETGEQDLRTIEVVADRQQYNTNTKIVTATGNVILRLPNGLLTADRLEVNLNKRLAVAEGQVILKRGEQVIRGDRFEYYLVDDSGIVFNANGEIYQPTTGSDFSPGLPGDVSAGSQNNFALSDRLALNQPLQRITTGQGYRFVVGGNQQQGGTGLTSESGGQVNRLRFQAQRLEFEGGNWDATDVKITNDPFSPPEFQLQAEKATFRNIAPLVDEIDLTNSRVVFDQNLFVPTFQDKVIIDKRARQPFFTFGYDGQDRGGLFIQRTFPLVDGRTVQFEITPQFLLQKALFPGAFSTTPTSGGSAINPGVFGLLTKLNILASPRTRFSLTADLPTLDLTQVGKNLRSRVLVEQKVGVLTNPHLLQVAYNYRERLFNGSLGYQTVEDSLGALIISPTIFLGDPSLTLSYQGSIQQIRAFTDRSDLLGPNPTSYLVSLSRYQGAATLSKWFMLWQGEALPPTPEEGLHYTPTPILPYVQLITGLTGVGSLYSNGDTQPSLTGTVGVLGQFGHFSANFLDYTGFNLVYSQAIRGDASPFLFDRFVDTKTLSFGITQQIYGPVRVGVQSIYSLESSQEISTDYFIEYSRRTYSLMLRYNPVLQLGSINLRISDFNWSGNPGTFDGSGVRPVVQGVTR